MLSDPSLLDLDFLVFSSHKNRDFKRFGTSARRGDSAQALEHPGKLNGLGDEPIKSGVLWMPISPATSSSVDSFGCSDGRICLCPLGCGAEPSGNEGVGL